MKIIDFQNEKTQKNYVSVISTSISRNLNQDNFGCIIKNTPVDSFDLFKSICDEVGSPITEQYFDSGTSDSHMHDVIAHLCLTSETKRTVLCKVDHILARLTEIEIDVLSSPIFEFSSGRAAVLTQHEGHYRLRYNGESINTTTLLYLAKDILKKLEDIIVEAGEQYILNQGDCLVINNHRVVYSKTNFSNAGGRLFKSVRLYQK